MSGGPAFVSGPILVPGVDVQAYDADLAALAALGAGPGMVAKTGAGTAALRTITGTAEEVAVANGDGSGAPTISLVANVARVTNYVYCD